VRDTGRFKIEIDMLATHVEIATLERFLWVFWRKTARRKFPHLRAAIISLVDGYFEGAKDGKTPDRKQRKRLAERLARKLVA